MQSESGVPSEPAESCLGLTDPVAVGDSAATETAPVPAAAASPAVTLADPGPSAASPPVPPSTSALSAPAADEPPPTFVAALEVEISHVRRDLDKANARFDVAMEETRDAQRRADEHAAVARRQTEMADELHAENRTLRQGEISKSLDPLIRGIARFADDLDRIAHDSPTPDDITYLRGQVDALLHDAGITQLRPAPGDPFDPQSQQAAGTFPTPDRTLDRGVAEVRRTGLRRQDGRMLRPTEVVVHRFVAPDEPVAPTPETDAAGVAESIEDPV